MVRKLVFVTFMSIRFVFTSVLQINKHRAQRQAVILLVPPFKIFFVFADGANRKVAKQK